MRRCRREEMKGVSREGQCGGEEHMSAVGPN